MYCSLTSSPAASRHSSRNAADVPFAAPAKPIGWARVEITSPGRIGRWKRKSCSPCTTRSATSGGATVNATCRIDMKDGTIANTGEATSPRRCASIGSFVASAYWAIRSRVTSNVSGALHCPTASAWNRTAEALMRGPCEIVKRKRSDVVGCSCHQFGEPCHRLVQLLRSGLLDRLADRADDHL